MPKSKVNISYNDIFPTRLRYLIDNVLVDGRKLTQTEVAERIGKQRQTIGQWFVGKTIPDIAALKAIAELYGVSADYLLGLSDAQTSNPDSRAIHEYTGLSEKAIEELHRTNESYKELESDQEYDLFTYLNDFICDTQSMNELYINIKYNISAMKSYLNQTERNDTLSVIAHLAHVCAFASNERIINQSDSLIFNIAQMIDEFKVKLISMCGETPDSLKKLMSSYEHALIKNMHSQDYIPTEEQFKVAIDEYEKKRDEFFSDTN